MKICTKCMINKDSTDYYLSNKTYSTYCKMCLIKDLIIKRKTVGTNQWWDRRRQRIRARAKRLGRDFSLTLDDVKRLLSQEYCVYCGIKPKVKSVDRIDNDKAYILSNCVMACVRCNNIKGNLTVKQIEQIHTVIKENSKSNTCIVKNIKLS